jgi:Tfp pilus assembly protein PilN
MVFTGGLIILFVLAGFYFYQVFTLQGVEDEIETQQAVNAQLEAEIASLQDIAALEDEIDRTRTVLSSLLVDRVLWSGILRDVSLVIPGEVWLNGLSAQLGLTSAEETGAPVAGGVVGQISFNGFAFDHRDVALWLSRLEDVRGFINPWLSTSAKTTIGEQDAVTFTSSVDLSEQAVARRGETTP